MPQIYRRPTEFSGSLQPTDADDSIVLSDLVRTGEASRLRRRGAMRIDHAGPHRPAVSMSVPPRDRLQQPPYVALASPTWSPDPDGIESDGEDGGGGAVLTRRDMFTEGRYGTVEYGDHGEGASGDSGVFTLYCGGQVGWEFEEEQSNWSSSSSSHYDPSPLPSYPPKSSSSSLHRTPSQLKKTNGCGAVVHVHASPRRRCFVWAANTPASASVVPLDTSYFDVGVRSMMMNSSCGCVKEGIGCAVCGNPLGTRYKPCQAAAEGIFSAPSRPPPSPLHPSGPRYWSSSHSAQNHHSRKRRGPLYLYTFFSSSVTPSPSYTFPAQSPPISSSSSYHPPPMANPGPPPQNVIVDGVSVPPAPWFTEGYEGYVISDSGSSYGRVPPPNPERRFTSSPLPYNYPVIPPPQSSTPIPRPNFERSSSPPPPLSVTLSPPTNLPTPRHSSSRSPSRSQTQIRSRSQPRAPRPQRSQTQYPHATRRRRISYTMDSDDESVDQTAQRMEIRREVQREREAGWEEYDADGVLLVGDGEVTEPGSPDKVWEAPLWSGR